MNSALTPRTTRFTQHRLVLASVGKVYVLYPPCLTEEFLESCLVRQGNVETSKPTMLSTDKRLLKIDAVWRVSVFEAAFVSTKSHHRCSRFCLEYDTHDSQSSFDDYSISTSAAGKRGNIFCYLISKKVARSFQLLVLRVRRTFAARNLSVTMRKRDKRNPFSGDYGESFAQNFLKHRHRRSQRLCSFFVSFCFLFTSTYSKCPFYVSFSTCIGLHI